jgi:DNA-binding NtrC family response regulator
LGTILVVDDDSQLRRSFNKLLLEEGHTVRTAATGEEAVEMVREWVPDVVVMDVRLPGMNGLETFQAVRRIEPKLPVIVMTAFGTTETAIEATKLGAYEYILKPFEILDILSLIGQAIDAGKFMRRRVEIDVAPENTSGEAIVGRSRAMQEVYKAIGRVALTDATVLIRGESGTGKELVARAIYQHSLRADKPFLVINCVAIPETLLESELFGYEKGAFTGAVSRRIGKVQQAHGGTIFLDEIGDMPFNIQAKILRLLQEKRIERLGGGEAIPVDVRILAATNRDLEAALAEGRFREDLYYRLKVVTLWLPALSDRADDVPLLADYFLARFAREMGIDNPGITEEARVMLKDHAWQGHVRELSNAMQKALIFSRGGPISLDEISRAVGTERAAEGLEHTADETIRRWMRNTLTSRTEKDRFSGMMDRFAGTLISEALNLTGGNRSRAAELLGISRPTLLAKIEKYGLKIETSVHSDQRTSGQNLSES